ncbi:hypothetical protein, partial [uncultured Ruegeria sp.]|uniref:hypothetical protein n=1 Tax=uncultured Ruegeria sp. TaxID=259304 RepID=UPI0026358E99
RIRLLLRKVEQTLHQSEGSFGGQVTANIENPAPTKKLISLLRAALKLASFSMVSILARRSECRIQ